MALSRTVLVIDTHSHMSETISLSDAVERIRKISTIPTRKIPGLLTKKGGLEVRRWKFLRLPRPGDLPPPT